jgi:hypothetical protein
LTNNRASTFFVVPGSYRAYWDWVFEECVKGRPQFGTTPHAASFDPLFEEKLEKAIQEGKFDPMTNYEHHLWLICGLICKTWLLRGSKEPSQITKDDFTWSVRSEGKYKGIECVRLKPSHLGQKQKKLTLSNYNRVDERNKDAHIEVLKTKDPLCLYNMLKRHIDEYMPPDCEGVPANRILRRKATQKQLKVCHFSLFAASNRPLSSLTTTSSCFYHASTAGLEEERSELHLASRPSRECCVWKELH